MLYPFMVAAVQKSVPGFNIDEFKPIEAARYCDVPAYFLHGAQDEFILPDHSVKNHAAYKG